MTTGIICQSNRHYYRKMYTLI